MLCFFSEKNDKRFFYLLVDGSKKKVRKDVFVRLRNEKIFLSTSRVTGRFCSEKVKKKVPPHNVKKIEKLPIIVKTDWVCIKYFSGVARMISFCVLDAQSDKTAKYPLDHVELTDNNSKQIGGAFQYFVLKSDGTLCLADTTSINEAQHYSLDCYKFHAPSPTKSNNVFRYNDETMKMLCENGCKVSPVKPFSSFFGRSAVANPGGTRDVDYNPSTSGTKRRASKRSLEKALPEDDEEVWEKEKDVYNRIKSRKRKEE